MKRVGRRALVASGVVSICLAIGAAGMIAGCSAQQPYEGQSSGSVSQDAMKVTPDTTMQELADVYPLQYNSYATLKAKSDDLREQYEKDGYELYENKARQLYLPQGHYAASAKEMGPLLREDDGSLYTTKDGGFAVDSLRFDSETGEWVVDSVDWAEEVGKYGYVKGCFACRSSKFDEAYESDGAQIYTEPVDEEFAEQLNGQMWDCAICHEDNNFDIEADATLSHFTQIAANEFDQFDRTDRVCGQCHSDSHYYPFITDQETLDSYDMYRNGTELEGLLKTQIEDGVVNVDEETGILEGVFDMPTLEMLQGGTHSELGLTCVDCHMPTVVDEETGETYTDHDASGSPLEKDASLELCLSCHASQGIESSDEMIDFVHEKQHGAREGLGAAKEKSAEVYDLILQSVNAESVDEDTLDQAKDDYTLAAAYLYFLNADSNGRAIHNYDKCFSYIARANELLDGIKDTLS